MSIEMVTQSSYFNPRSPRGERLIASMQVGTASKFQSTLPAWGATLHSLAERIDWHISIHAPRVGSDFYCVGYCVGRCISIHAPRVGSDSMSSPRSSMMDEFQSTLPAWGATLIAPCPCFYNSRFQSTLPAWGATVLPMIVYRQ